MKIYPLIVSHSELSGGAARAAHRLTRALRDQHIDATMLVANKMSDASYVIGPETRLGRTISGILPRINKKITDFQKTPNSILHSTNVIPGFTFKQIENSSADVVNLHWVNKEMLSISEISRINKPVVFTLHDMWAFCGSEHLSPDSQASRFRKGYTKNNRPKTHAGIDIDRWTWERKCKHWSKPRHVICPSSWLGRCAQESVLMKNWPVHVVPNALDVSCFQPLDKQMCRKILGLPVDIPLIAFNGIGNDFNKGFDLLANALNVVAVSGRLTGAECLVFGQSEFKNPPKLGFPLRFVGRMHDEWSLVLLYNAVDIVVVPSRQENLPQTATEAHACGTPVVAFNTAGVPDVVDHKTTGYLAEPFEVDDMANGICWVLEDRDRYAMLAVEARQRAVSLWSHEVVVPQYLDIYFKAINKN